MRTTTRAENIDDFLEEDKGFLGVAKHFYINESLLGPFSIEHHFLVKSKRYKKGVGYKVCKVELIHYARTEDSHSDTSRRKLSEAFVTGVGGERIALIFAGVMAGLIIGLILGYISGAISAGSGLYMYIAFVSGLISGLAIKYTIEWYSEVCNRVGNRVDTGVGTGMGGVMGSGLGSVMGSGVSGGVGSAVGSGVGSGVSGGVGNAVGNGVGSAVGSGVGSAVGSGMMSGFRFGISGATSKWRSVTARDAVCKCIVRFHSFRFDTGEKKYVDGNNEYYDLLAKGEWIMVSNDKYPTDEEVLEEKWKIAEKCIGQEGYSLLTNNCEHFVTSILTGESECEQIRRKVRAAAASTGAIFGSISSEPLAGTATGSSSLPNVLS